MKNIILYIYFCIFSIFLFGCTTGEQLESTGTDVTGNLHHVRKKLYKRTDTKVSIKEYHNNEFYVDTLTVLTEKEDTIVFKSTDVSLNLLARDLVGVGLGEKVKSTRIIIKNKIKKYFFKAKQPIKLPKESYVSCAYLCNNRGISIKTTHSIKLYSFKVIDEKLNLIDQKQPMIFINRPMPSEKGAVLFDFILANASLSDNALLVKVKIDGIDFFVDKWVPFVIHGLHPGKHKIEVNLINEDDQELENYFSKDSREFIIK